MPSRPLDGVCLRYRTLCSPRLLLAREVADVAPQGGDDPREVAELGGAEVDAIAHVGNRLGAVASELAAGGEHHGQRRAPVGGVGVPADELLLFGLVGELGDPR